MGLICNAFVDDIPQMLTVFAVLLGIGGTIGICGGISGLVIGNVISSINTNQAPIIASLVATAFLLMFLILSPSLVRTQQYNQWVSDSGRTEVDNKEPDIFAKYRLSKRELEVCKLLLEGYTLRQISGILSIAYSTVNTYYTSAYRKLGINSRAELLILFKDYIK